MSRIKNGFIVIAVIVIIMIFIYFFGSGAMDGGMDGMNYNNSWMSGHNWVWIPSIVTLLAGVLIGWLLFRKKN